MGRPKKKCNQLAPAYATACDDYDDGFRPTTSFTPGSGLNKSSNDVSVSHSSMSTADATTISTSSNASDPTTRQVTDDIWDIGRAAGIDTAPSQAVHAPHSLGGTPQTPSNPFEPARMNPLQAPQADDTIASNVSLVDQGYIAVLTALATIERSVATEPLNPSIELVFQAEKDFRTLKDRIILGVDNASHSESSTFRPANSRTILMLSLLSERVVSVLEIIFRATLSTMSARTVEPDIAGQVQDHELPWTASFGTGVNQQMNVDSATRRLGRSFRSFIDQPCVFPVPGGKSKMQFGTHELAMPATARAIKAILHVRLQKMMAALLDLRNEMQRLSQLQVDVAHGQIYVGSSDATLRNTVADLLQNLIRRLEGLQGAMVLVG